jgi:hypothetical protein
MFEENPSFGSIEEWEEEIKKNENLENFKFPVSFKEEFNLDLEIEDSLIIHPPDKKENKIKIVEISKSSKSKKKNNLF